MVLTSPFLNLQSILVFIYVFPYGCNVAIFIGIFPGSFTVSFLSVYGANSFFFYYFTLNVLEENVLSVCECECIFYLSGSSTNKSASRVMTSSDLTGISLFVSYFCFITTISCFFEHLSNFSVCLCKWKIKCCTLHCGILYFTQYAYYFCSILYSSHTFSASQ